MNRGEDPFRLGFEAGFLAGVYHAVGELDDLRPKEPRVRKLIHRLLRDVEGSRPWPPS